MKKTSEQLAGELMTIREIAQLVKWKQVKRAIKYFYPDDKNDYEGLFKKIQGMRKRKQKDSEERIEIYAVGELESPKERYYSIFTNKYSLSFRGWNEIANVPIAETTLEHYELQDILAHFIWEITFYGTEEQMKKEKKERKKWIPAVE